MDEVKKKRRFSIRKIEAFGSQELLCGGAERIFLKYFFEFERFFLFM